MRRTRVLIVEMTGMLRDIVRDAVIGQPDMELVGDVATRERAPAVIIERQADVVLVGRELSLAAGPDWAVLRICMDRAVLGLTQDGRRAFRYELRPASVPVTTDGEGLAPKHLIAAIRGAAANRSHPQPA